MFRAMIAPIFRSTRLCITTCGIIHPRCCQPATSWVHYTTSFNTQSSTPEDGRNHRPKHVELIGIINKPLLFIYLVVYIIYINDARSSIHQIGFFFENELLWQFDVENKLIQTAVLGHIFVQVQIKC